MKVTVVNGNVDKAHKILKRRMLKANLAKKLKAKVSFESPTKKRRIALNQKEKLIQKHNESLKKMGVKK